MIQTKEIYCCGCKVKQMARLTNGGEIYPHRQDLYELPFWKCPACGNHVGCHHKTSTPTQPLGYIPTPQIRKARIYIHALLDPLWKNGKFRRREIYQKLTDVLGWNYHTSKIRDIEEAREVYRVLLTISQEAA